MQQFLLIFTVVLLVGGLVLRRFLKARTMWVSNPSDQQNVLIEKEIRNQLSKPAGELTKSDLARVDTLFFSGAYLTDTGLKELAKVQNLKDLCLWCCPVIDADLNHAFRLEGETRVYARFMRGPIILEVCNHESMFPTI